MPPHFSYYFVYVLMVASVFQFPMTAYIVAGTQAAPGKQNFVIVMKMSQLDKTNSENDEDEESEKLHVQILLTVHDHVTLSDNLKLKQAHNYWI